MKPGDVIGSWKLERMLGSGYFGTTFLARDTHGSDWEIALKVLPVQAGGAAQLEAEVNAVFGLNHQNVVAYRERPMPCSSEGREYMAFGLELCDATLEQVLGLVDHSSDDLDQLMRWVVPDVLSALRYLRREGVVHRDIHMGNVLIRRGIWKVGDFGLARPLDADGLYSSRVAGLRELKAPEELEHGEASHASDVYMLGAMVFAILTGGLTSGEPFEVDPGHPGVPDEWRSFITLACADLRIRRTLDLDGLVNLVPVGGVKVEGLRASVGGMITAAGVQQPMSPSSLESAAGAPSAHRSGIVGERPFDRPLGRPGPVALVATVAPAGGGSIVHVVDRRGTLFERDPVAAFGAGWTLEPSPTANRVVAIASGSHESGHREVFVADDTGRLHHRWVVGGEWSDWHRMGHPARAVASLACSSLGSGHLELFMVGEDGRAHHRWWLQGEGWSDWADFSEGQAVGLGAITAVSFGPLGQMVFALHEPRRQVLLRLFSQFEHRWSNWAWMDDQPDVAVAVAAASISPQHVEVFTVDDVGSMWQVGWGPVPRWSEWRRLGAPPGRTVINVAACSRGDGHQEVFAVDDLGLLWNRWCVDDAGHRTWSGWDALVGPAARSHWEG